MSKNYFQLEGGAFALVPPGSAYDFLTYGVLNFNFLFKISKVTL